MPPQGRLGDKSFVPADSHGCKRCPHSCIGPAVTGSPNTLVNFRAALRVTDRGTHAACCGPNRWVAAAGSPTVFINFLPAHRLGDLVNHCGGSGRLVQGSPNVIVGNSPSSAARGSPAAAENGDLPRVARRDTRTAPAEAVADPAREGGEAGNSAVLDLLDAGVRLFKFSVDLFDKIKILRFLRIGHSRDKYFTLRGAIRALGVHGGGKYKFLTATKKIFSSGAKKSAVLAGIVAMAREAIAQAREGRFEPDRLLATGGTGAAKGLIGTFVFAAVKVGVKVGLAAVTSKVWVPIAVSVGAYLLVSYALDKADERFGITDGLARGLSAGWQGIRRAGSAVRGWFSK